MDIEMYPFKFRPIYKQRIWGGHKLRELFGKDTPADTKIGESWELADLPDDKSVIENGPLAGLSLSEAVEKYPLQITGSKDFALPFPLLIKLLDAQDMLSIQVHPDRQSCLKMGKGDPKTECWYIVQAQPGAFIYKGLKKGVTKQQFADAIEAGAVEHLLEKVPVKNGQCHFLPAGTVHSIGAGLMIAEIQTPSDTTYRVFDFNRVDKTTGRPRQLHVAEALESIHFDKAGEPLPVTTQGRLVDCEYFKIDKHRQQAGSEVSFGPSQMRVMLTLSGSGAIIPRPADKSTGPSAPNTGQYDSGPHDSEQDNSEPNNSNQYTVEFRAGDCLLIPFDCQAVMRFAEDAEYLLVTI